MKLKKKNLMIGTIIGAVALIIIILLLLNNLTPKVEYTNIISDRPILGSANAKVKVVEFSDLECPACKTTSNYPQRLINDFGNDISVEFKHFPLTFHKDAYKSALAAECANDQGKFWEFVEIAFKNHPRLSVSDLKKYAKTIGVETTSFNACLDSEAKKEVVDAYLREGYALQIPGTPTFFVNGKMSSSIQYEDIKLMIQEELNKK